MADTENHVKILFRFYSEFLEEETVETMWAQVVDEIEGLYKIDNIPFYARSIASDDVVFAEFDETESQLVFRYIVEFSGNSTVRVVRLKDSVDINEIRKTFECLGCLSEKVNDGYFAMEIPANVDYKNIKQNLNELQLTGLIDFEEACLSEEHQQ